MKRTTALISAILSLSSLFLMPVQSTMAATDSPATSVALQGNQAIAAKHGTLISHKNANDVVSVTLTLNLHNRDQMNAFLADLYNPTSPNYKKFLTPHQFAAKFGPTTTDVQKVAAFATANGLKITHVAAGNQSVTVSGAVSNLERAFGVRINNYHNVKGQTYFANATTPTVPIAVASVINGVVGLDNEPKQKEHAIRATVSKVGLKQSSVSPNQSKLLGGPIGGYAPSDLRSAYDITPLTNAGYDGTGQKIALVEFDGFVQSNISTYDNKYGLGSSAPTAVSVDGYNVNTHSDGESEVELDIEVLNAIAPKAQVQVYEAPNDEQGMLDMYQQIATDDTANTVSTSWGMDESDAAPFMDSLDGILAQMAAQGQSVFAATGDNGAYDNGDGVTLSVDSPASDPNVTGVGGTSLDIFGDGYRYESAWSDYSSGSGGGGGLSSYFSQPSWQTGPGVQNNGQRQVPDVSADADPSTGYSIYTGGQWTVYGGTSAATPLWAGIAALNDQYAANLQKPILGQANPVLYNLFNNAQTYPAFHDVTDGDNLYYSAGTGYDLATGIGTPDAYNLIRDLNGGTGTMLSITANASTLVVGQSEALKLMSVTGAGKPVNVTSTAKWTSSNPTVASVRSGMLYTTAPGTATLTATYNDATATFAITVTPKLTGLSLGTKTMSMQVGDTKQLAATASYSDGSSVDVTSSVNWSSSNPSSLWVDTNGELSAYKKGSVVVTGRYQGQTVTLTVTVTPVLQSMTVSPSSSTVTIGGAPLLLKVKANYNDGTSADVSRVATLTSESGLVTIRNGMIYGAQKGNDLVDVSYNGQTAQVALSVVPQLKTLQVAPVPKSIQVGSTQQLAVTAVYNDGSTADVTSLVTWASSNKTVAGVDATGLVTTLKRGTATISGKYQNRSVSVSVSVVPVLTQITATVPQSLAVGRSAAVLVMAIYNDGSKASLGNLATLTSANGDFTVRGSVITGKTAGQDTVTVTYGGQTVSVPITITAH